jgi:hypothetical protein
MLKKSAFESSGRRPALNSSVAEQPQPAGARAALGSSLAILRRFWAVAARRKFALRSVRSAEAQAIQLEDPLEVREQHFDLLPLGARGEIGVGLRQVASHVAQAG